MLLFAENGWENYGGTPEKVTWEFAAGKWTNITATAGSSYPLPGAANDGGCMAWDPSGSYFLGLIGSTANIYDGATWKFSGGTWATTTAAVQSFVGFCSMAWDPVANEMVAYYPGYNSTHGHTVIWTGSTWTDISSSSGTASVGCVYSNELAWDAHDQEVVAFGGDTCSASANEAWTWAFSNGKWTNLTSGLTTSPPAGNPDAVAGVSGGALFMTEGTTVNAAPEFWFFGGGSWTSELVAADPTYGSPCQRVGSMMGAINGTTALLFGGDPIATTGSTACLASTGGYFNDSWQFNGVPALTTPSTGGTTSATGNGSASARPSLGCGSIMLSWTNGPPPSGTTLVNVTVYLYSGYSNGTVPIQVISTNGPISSLQLNGLACNSHYTWQIRDWYSSGSAGPLSGTFGFVTGGALATVPSSCLTCGGASSWWPWLLLLLVVVAATVGAYVWSRDSRRGGGRRIG
ncbi:MAG: hypothetical protein ACYDDZ_06610 [Acidimicrobiales bacterium]